MNKNSKYIVATMCLVVIIFRIIFPKLTFDLISVSLLAIGTLAMLIKNPERLFDKAKKIKLGSFELELQELNQKIEKVEKNMTEQIEGPVGLGAPVIEHGERIYETSKDYSMDLIQLSIEIEKTLRVIFDYHFKSEQKRPLSITKMIDMLGVENVIDNDITNLLKKFWNIRNQLIHNHNFEIQKMSFIAFNDIGVRVLKILKVIKIGFTDENDGLHHYGMA